MSYVSEFVLNVAIAEVLSRVLGVICCTESSTCNGRPEIRCYYNAIRVSIEVSYGSDIAEQDAVKKVEKGLADLALAVHYIKKVPKVAEAELPDLLGGAPFRVKVFAPQGFEGVLKYLASKTRLPDSDGGWIEGVGLEDLANIIRYATTYIVSEFEFEDVIRKIKQVVEEFIKSASDLGVSGTLRKQVAEILYRLYGFSIAEAREGEILFGQAALALLLSAVLFERTRHRSGLPSLVYYLKLYDSITGLKNALEDVLKTTYEPTLKLALELLGAISPELGSDIEEIVEAALSIAGKPHLLARDLAGRIYHEITGDIAVKKGFATFYTEVPAAHLLANLALRTKFELERELSSLQRSEVAEIVKRVGELKIADFACGSGTLLTASLYSAARIAKAICFLHNLECPNIEEKLVEDGIYGLDALMYAAQIASINLAIMSSTFFTRRNIGSVYLGYTPSEGARLGSLELLDEWGKAGGSSLSASEDREKGTEMAPAVIVDGVGKERVGMYDIVIMNPPFTRSTGRAGRGLDKGRRGFFGFITDEKARDSVLRRYREICGSVRRDLTKISMKLFSEEVLLREVLGPLSSCGMARANGVGQYYGIGQAGEGLPFLYLAYKYVKPGGVIAFVLPRNVLSGISWFLARALLADSFHLKYVVVSSDGENGYNFSENTDMSECLIIAKRVCKHDEGEETVFINLLEKPKSALEAALLVEEVFKCGNGLVELSSGAKCLVRRVGRAQLLENLDNLNRVVSLPDLDVVEFGLKILKQGDLGVENLVVPLVRLGEIVEAIGLDSPQFHEHFKRVDAETPYPVVFGGSEAVRARMVVEPNAFAEPKTAKASELFKKYSGRVLLPDRIWLDTAHTTATYSKTPVISNVFYVAKLRNLPLEAEKALVLWLNTTWGTLSILLNREETRGRWIRLKKAQWRLLPVLNTSKLSANTLGRIAKAFEELSPHTPQRIPSQYSENPSCVDQARLRIDMEFVKAFDPSIDEDRAMNQLLKFYKRMATAFKYWVR